MAVGLTSFTYSFIWKAGTVGREILPQTHQNPLHLIQGRKNAAQTLLTPSHFPAFHLVWLVRLGIAQRVKLLAPPGDRLF